MAHTDINERFDAIIEQGWRYIYDGRNWSSGCWIHDQYGFINDGGDNFRSVVDAVPAAEKFIEALAMIQR